MNVFLDDFDRGSTYEGWKKIRPSVQESGPMSAQADELVAGRAAISAT